MVLYDLHNSRAASFANLEGLGAVGCLPNLDHVQGIAYLVLHVLGELFQVLRADPIQTTSLGFSMSKDYARFIILLSSKASRAPKSGAADTHRNASAEILLSSKLGIGK